MLSVKFNPAIEIPEIRMPIYSESPENDPNGPDHDTTIIQQTKLDGVMVPLVRINNQTIFYTQIQYMKLSCSNLPELYIVIDDQLGLIKNLDTPGWDNILQLQILPPFDGGYKKINLLFYITSISIDGSIMSISASYHIPHLWDCQMKAYGQITTYELMEQVAKELGLGFASNMDSSDDSRYIYNPMKSTPEFLSNTVAYAHDKSKETVYSWWIDYWNCLNFVDIYTEYNKIIPDDELMIWVQDTVPHPGGDDQSDTLVQMIAALNNHPLIGQNAMSITGYIPMYSSPGVTDQIFETYHIDKQDFETTYIENKDVKDNIKIKYVYGGEIFGDYDYLSRKAARNMFLSKINAQRIQTSTMVPTLGRVRGDKINVWWYDSDNYITSSIQEEANKDMTTNIEVPDDIKIDANAYIINKAVSGQYYIENITYIYNAEFQWEQVFELSRDGIDKDTYNPVEKTDAEKN